MHGLQLLSWTLNININIIGFKRSRHYVKCHHRNCYLPYYIFQNTCVKVLREPSNDFPTIIIYYFKRKYFESSSSNIPNPLLINLLPNTSITFQNTLITTSDIIQILQHKTMIFPFNIYIYSSYKFTKHNVKSIIPNMIGSHISDSTDSVHIFVAPHLHDFHIDIHLLNIKENVDYKLYDILPDFHKPEGNKIFKENLNPQEEMLNQEFCVCDNPTMNRFYAPKHTSFKHIAKGTIQQYLYENLGTHFVKKYGITFFINIPFLF